MILQFFYGFILSTLLPETVLSGSVPLSGTTTTYKQLNAQFHEKVDFIAVFLLASLKNAIELGEKPNFSHGRNEDFFARISAAQQTWAYNVRHFYAVVGNGVEEKRVLANTSACHSITKHYLDVMKKIPNIREEVYRCGNTKILYLPYCDTSGWGPDGPCCRCEGAMKFYSNMEASLQNYPKWFLFADDDYFLRIHKFHGLASQVDYNKPLAVTEKRGSHLIHGSSVVTRTSTFAWLPFFDNDCSVPCTHHTVWLGFAIFSVGAMKLMAEEVQKGGLIQACKLWTITHDVGLGIFVWEHAIPSLPVCCGPTHPDEGNLPGGIFYHAIGKGSDSHGKVYSHDYVQHRVWQIGASKRGETSPNMTAFIQYEFNEGVQAYLPPYPTAGFENSLFFRKLQFSEVMAKQIPDEQLKTLPNMPIRRSSYGPGECQKEMQFHQAWREASGSKYPLHRVSDAMAKQKDANHQRVKVDYKLEPKMCAEYLEAIANTPIHLSNLSLPDLDKLIRQRG